ncbi:hypothetical protein CASFOL_004454 [Castilleja foliolosa]|uniref:Ubiquitin-like protease family profile domain-containing protein n=1 Tax=Castilleja foliolosa TaxID=1961234 RepID=A0ABD3EB31_9LAMI
MKNAAVKPQDSYHIYGFSHAFMHFIVEAVPGLAGIITSKTKHNCVQPRLLKLVFEKKSVSLYLDFFDKQDIQCHEKLEPTEQELIDYTWWPHVDDDVRSYVKYIHRESNKAKKALLLKQTREQSPVPEQGQGDESITAEEVMPQKRAHTTERPNVDSGELLTRILEGVRRENELLEQRLMREIREIEERRSRKADDLRSEIEELRKTVEELQRHKNYVPFDENIFNFEPSSATGKSPPPPPKTKTPSPPPVINQPSPSAQTTTQTTAQETEQTKMLKTQKAQGRTPEQKTPPPPPSADDLYVPFDGNFIDDIEAFADKTDYVHCRREDEPEFTPIERLNIKISEYLTPIKAKRVSVRKAQSNKFITIRRAVRPPNDSDFDTHMNSKHMKAYNAYLESGSKEMRDCGSGMCQYEDVSYFKDVENPSSKFVVQTIDSYLRILHLNPEFLGCHPEAREKYLIYPSIFGTFLAAVSESMYKNKAPAIRDEDKGKMDELNPEDYSVKILLDLVQGKPIETLESWGQLVPITEVDKIYVVWLAHEHFYPLVIDLVKCEVWIIDSLANQTDEDKRFSRYKGTMCLRHILPALLQLTGFYDVRKDLKPVNREWDLRFADKDQCFKQTDDKSCGPFSCKMMEVLVTRRQLPNITEENMKYIRKGIAERIFSFSK